MITPSQSYRRSSYPKPRDLLNGADAFIHSLAGRFRRRTGVPAELLRDAAEVGSMEKEWRELSDQTLKQRLLEFRQQFRRGGRAAESNLLPALAGLREAADRRLGLRPFIVQLAGALALHRGMLVEMATGEGKTLTAGLAAALSGWNPHPCHIVTVNDYLVRRDAKWIEPFYRFCGVRVGTVTAGMQTDDRREGHAQDITYTTSKELLADFLRDRLRSGNLRFPAQHLIRDLLHPKRLTKQNEAVLRGLHTAIIDEADSILIDEAVTPLIIASPQENKTLERVVTMANRIVEPLEAETDYRIDLQYREVSLNKSGRSKIANECAELPGIWQGMERREELIRQALVAREFFLRDKQYIVVKGKVVIVDEFSGRPMPERSWRQGMHQAIEAKEGVEISKPSETTARLSFQRFFRFFKRLSGMTGTAREAAGEFWQIYRLPVVSIPTNKPCIRRQLPDRIFATATEKWTAVVEEIKRVHATNRPILVGTRSVSASEKIAELLNAEHVGYRLLNAVHHVEEAQVIADAGQAGKVTLATNMAGRGTDITLGEGVAKLGGLHVLGTEKHESGRVDRQLFGRSGRQGDPGSAQMFASLEDELIRRRLNRSIARGVTKLLASGVPGSETAAATAFSRAQTLGQGQAYKQRKAVLQMDNWMENALAFTGVEDL